MNSRRVCVIIPAYNEEETVGEVVKRLKLLSLDLEIYVVDDGSSDETAERAREAGAMVIRHPVNLGQWAALRTAFIVATSHSASVVVTVDADMQHNPRDLSVLVKPILEDEADLVIGSRFLSGDEPEMPTYRSVGIRFFSWLLSRKLKMALTDCTCGYKAYRTELVRRMVPELRESQYGALEALIQAKKIGARICERPITTNMSIKAKSKKGALKYGYNLLRSVLKCL